MCKIKETTKPKILVYRLSERDTILTKEGSFSTTFCSNSKHSLNFMCHVHKRNVTEVTKICYSVPVIGRTLIREGQLPGCPPVLVTGGTLIRKEQQFTWTIWRLQEPSSSGIDDTMQIMHGKGICTSRKSRYALAEPKGSVIYIEVHVKKIQHQLFSRTTTITENASTLRDF